MPRIPEYDERFRYAGRASGLGGRLEPGNYGQAAEALGAGGQIADRQLQRAGAAVTRAADTVAAIHDDYNTARAQAALNALQTNFLAWQSEMSRKKGQAGMDAGAQYAQWQKKQVAELTGDMNEIQRGRFNALAEIKAAGFRKWAADYGGEQNLVCRNAEDVAGIKAEADTLVANLANVEIAGASEERIKDLAFQIAQRKGLGEEATKALMRDSVAEAVTPAIAAQIDAGRLNTARTALLRYRAALGEGNALKLRNAITREGERQEARARAESERARAESAISGVQNLFSSTAGLSPEEQRAAILDEIGKVKDMRAQMSMYRLAEGELTFRRQQREAAVNVQAMDMVKRTREMGPVERNRYFVDNATPKAVIDATLHFLNRNKTHPAVISEAKAMYADGKSLDEINSELGKSFSPDGWSEFANYTRNKELQKANTTARKFFSAQLLNSGIDPKNEDDTAKIAEIQANFEEMVENGEFRTRDEQRNWIYEQLARRRAPGMFFGENEYSPREAAGRNDVYLPVPPWEVDNIIRQLAGRGIHNSTPQQIQDVYNAQTGLGRRQQSRSEDITPLTPIYW